MSETSECPDTFEIVKETKGEYFLWWATDVPLHNPLFARHASLGKCPLLNKVRSMTPANLIRCNCQAVTYLNIVGPARLLILMKTVSPW